MNLNRKWGEKGGIIAFVLAAFASLYVAAYWYAPWVIAGSDVSGSEVLTRWCGTKDSCKKITGQLTFSKTKARPIYLVTITVKPGRTKEMTVNELQILLDKGEAAAPWMFRWLLRDGGTEVAVTYA